MVIAQGGLGSLSRIDLEKVLAGTTAFVRADIGDTEEGLGGGAAAKISRRCSSWSISRSPRRGPIRSPSAS